MRPLSGIHQMIPEPTSMFALFQPCRKTDPSGDLDHLENDLASVPTALWTASTALSARGPHARTVHQLSAKTLLALADEVIESCRLVTLRVNSWRRSNSIAFRAKRTFNKSRLQNRTYEYAPLSAFNFHGN